MSPVTAPYQTKSAKMGFRIKRAREDAGLSQERLATKIKTSRRNVLRWEGGYNMPRPEHIAAVAEATGKTTDFFLNGDADDEEESDLYAALVSVMRDIARHEAEKALADHGAATT